MRPFVIATTLPVAAVVCAGARKPVKVTGISNVSAAYLGGPHSVAVRADGTFWIWGVSFNGQGVIGKNLHVPTLLDLP
jgi:alpha-tubulin suppressor-like RCC1 family protein